MALRYQQSCPTWWGVGRGHWTSPELHPHAPQQWDTAFLRAECGLGQGVQSEDTGVASPESDAIFPTAQPWGTQPFQQQDITLAEGRRLGTWEWHPQSWVPCPQCLALWDAALPGAELTHPGQGLLHQPCAPCHVHGPRHLSPHCQPRGNAEPGDASATGLGELADSWDVVSGAQDESPLKANRAQAAAELCGMAARGTSSAPVCCQPPSPGLAVVLDGKPLGGCSPSSPILSSGPCGCRRGCNSWQEATSKPRFGAGGPPKGVP